MLSKHKLCTKHPWRTKPPPPSLPPKFPPVKCTNDS